MHSDELDVDHFNVFWQLLATLGSILAIFGAKSKLSLEKIQLKASLGSGIFYHFLIILGNGF